MYPTVKREQRVKQRIIRGKAVVSQSHLAHLVGVRSVAQVEEAVRKNWHGQVEFGRNGESYRFKLSTL